jgi:EAL domain-containing protein (putative c-di-GMP-specific phosphodiesterase class I)
LPLFPPSHVRTTGRERSDGRLELQDGRYVARFADLILESAFQPVLSFAHGRAIGHEALLRAQDEAGQRVSPLAVFARFQGEGRGSELDIACRALHLANFTLEGPPEGWALFNFTPSAVVDDRTTVADFRALLEQHAVPPHQVVVEILESKAYDEEHLARVVSDFKSLGCVVALDDFGAGQSNFERIWRIAPDVVKLDRSMLVEAMRTSRVRRLLPGLVSLLHEAGCLVVMEGVEDEEQALAAMEMDADFVQGFLFARPSPSLEPREYGELFGRLFERFRQRGAAQTTLARESLARYVARLEESALALRSGRPLPVACLTLLSLTGVERAYLLDGNGVQVGETLHASAGRETADPRHEPFADGHGANWALRPYFRRAVSRPGVPQVSPPYLSMTDARSCITLSYGVEVASALHVLCVDLDLDARGTIGSSPSWRPPMGSWNDF